MNNLIGIAGKISHGKDLLFKILQHNNWVKMATDSGILIKDGYYPFDDWNGNLIGCNEPYENVKFADAIKDITCRITGCTRKDLENKKFKESPLPNEWNKYQLVSTNVPHDTKPQALLYSAIHPGIPPVLEVLRLTPRRLMQILGTEMGREMIHSNIWVNALFSQYDAGRKDSKGGEKKWIITDVRFINEVEAIRDRGGIVIRVIRPDFTTVSKHSHGPGGGEEHESEVALDRYDKFDHVFINDGSVGDFVKKVGDWMDTTQ